MISEGLGVLLTELLQPGNGSDTLSETQIDEILLKPNGPFVLLEMVRLGKITPERAVTAIDRVKPPFLKRLAMAVLDTFFSS